MDRRVFLYLLDSPEGHPVQFWSLDGKDLVRIGRALDNDVVIPHPYVSRAHAYLAWADDGWQLTALSDQGVIHGSETRRQLALVENDVFRLGPGGPWLRFTSSGTVDGSSRRTLQAPGSGTQIVLALDRKLLAREVEAITVDPYFRRIQASIHKLRGR